MVIDDNVVSIFKTIIDISGIKMMISPHFCVYIFSKNKKLKNGRSRHSLVALNSAA